MEIIFEIIRNTLPSIIILYGVYLIVKAFLNKQFAINLSQAKTENTQFFIKLRLQAYERISVYLERMMPNNLIIRLNQGNYTANELRHILLHHIKEEFEHNISQQVYISDAMWELIKGAKEELIVEINNASKSLSENASAMDLSKKILETFMKEQANTLTKVATQLKAEARLLFQ